MLFRKGWVFIFVENFESFFGCLFVFNGLLSLNKFSVYFSSLENRI